MVDALRATKPDLDGALKAYNTISTRTNRATGESIDDAQQFADALSALETLVSPISVERVGATELLNKQVQT